jgi:hypothetical protein
MMCEVGGGQLYRPLTHVLVKLDKWRSGGIGYPENLHRDRIYVTWLEPRIASRFSPSQPSQPNEEVYYFA